MEQRNFFARPLRKIVGELRKNRHLGWMADKVHRGFDMGEKPKGNRRSDEDRESQSRRHHVEFHAKPRNHTGCSPLPSLLA